MNIHLFFGFQTDENFEEQYKQVNPHLRRAFVNEKTGNHLSHMEINGERYLGRVITNHLDMERIFVIQANIASIIQRMMNSWTSSKYPMLVVPFTDNQINLIDG
tara:strand:- start:544 stop:855 length:312 start_codon:yes stop_codon:yes gene_type:complete